METKKNRIDFKLLKESFNRFIDGSVKTLPVINKEGMGSDELEQVLKEYHAVSHELKSLGAKVDNLKASQDELYDKLLPEIQALEAAGQKIKEVDGYVLTITRKTSVRGRVNYEDAFKLLLKKVNDATRQIAQAFLDSTYKESSIKAGISVNRKPEVNEAGNQLDALVNKLSVYADKLGELASK